MDIKKELINSVPTIAAKRLFVVMLVFVPLVTWGLGEINPLWPNLGAKELVVAKISLALFITSLLSLAANIYYIYKLKKLGRFIDNKIPELVEKFAEHKISQYKNYHNSNNEKIS